jgi:predicted nucleic acid-binding protein
MARAQRPIYVAEPLAPFAVRQPAVIDCSLLGAVLFDEPEREQARALMAGRWLCAPRLLDHEIVSVAITKARRGLPADDARQALAEYAEIPIEIADPLRHEQFELALRYGVSGYDAAYLWLAAELRAPLLTLDKKLADAARRHLESLG